VLSAAEVKQSHRQNKRRLYFGCGFAKTVKQLHKLTIKHKIDD